ncbi:MAG TPA: hypothetical protein VKZ46_06925, partial [Pedomonas sp.]|nr:hypothetical protein [Pedomonas sp.]
DMTLREQQAMQAEAERAAVLADPLVRAAMETFPGAELIDIIDTDDRNDDMTSGDSAGEGVAPAEPLTPNNSLRSAQR